MSRIKIERSIASGDVNVPPSKSMAHRALIAGALTGGSVIRNIAYSKDILATLGCLEAMGANVKRGDSFVEIGGLDPFNIPENASLFCNESGSTLRFLIPLALLGGSCVSFGGSERLFERPLDVYSNICECNGVRFDKRPNGLSVCGNIKSGEYTVPGNVSSQFITGLLFALPIVSGDSVLNVTGKFESASYIDLTLSVLRDFGIDIERSEKSFYIKGGQRYKAFDYTVEGDCSNAAFLDSLNYLGGNVSVLGVRPDTLQGDRVYKEMLDALQGGQKEFDLSDCPDLAPVMFAMSAFFGGAVFTGTARLKIKESDRAAAMAAELGKFGISVKVFDNSVIVEKGLLKKTDEILYGHNDHRIVMSLALLCSVTGGIIDGTEAVSKSFPDFFDVISSWGIKTSRVE